MASPLLVANNDKTELCLVTGATGTGKTVTLQGLAHGPSALGQPGKRR